MENRKLSNTGIAVSSLGLGTMYFGSETPTQKTFDIMDAYVEAGGNLIDTANVYVGGKSEDVFGRWFANRPREVTDRVFLATKGRNSVHSTRGVHRPADGRGGPGDAPAAVQPALAGERVKGRPGRAPQRDGPPDIASHKSHTSHTRSNRRCRDGYSCDSRREGPPLPA